MSATTAATVRELPHRPRTPGELPTPLTAFVAAAIAVAVGLIALGLWQDRGVIPSAGWDLVVWLTALWSISTR